jgi:hypothetical protein
VRSGRALKKAATDAGVYNWKQGERLHTIFRPGIWCRAVGHCMLNKIEGQEKKYLQKDMSSTLNEVSMDGSHQIEPNEDPINHVLALPVSTNLGEDEEGCHNWYRAKQPQGGTEGNCYRTFRISHLVVILPRDPWSLGFCQHHPQGRNNWRGASVIPGGKWPLQCLMGKSSNLVKYHAKQWGTS